MSLFITHTRSNQRKKLKTRPINPSSTTVSLHFTSNGSSRSTTRKIFRSHWKVPTLGLDSSLSLLLSLCSGLLHTAQEGETRNAGTDEIWPEQGYHPIWCTNSQCLNVPIGKREKLKTSWCKFSEVFFFQSDDDGKQWNPSKQSSSKPLIQHTSDSQEKNHMNNNPIQAILYLESRLPVQAMDTTQNSSKDDGSLLTNNIPHLDLPKSSKRQPCLKEVFCQKLLIRDLPVYSSNNRMTSMSFASLYSQLMSSSCRRGRSNCNQ